MEPRNEQHTQREQQQILEPSKDPPKKRFRLVRLEERIAPAKGGVTSPHNGCLTPGANHNGYTTGL